MRLFLFGADGGSRTRDLILTKDVLYQLSYISALQYYIKYICLCQ